MAKKANLLFIIILIAIFFIFWMLFSYFQNKSAKDTLVIYGNVDVRNVALSFRVSGRLAKMHFEEGDHVEKEQVLASLDKDTFIADLEMAKAELAQATANAYNATLTFNRRDKLSVNGAVSQAAYNDAVASLKTNQAQVGVKNANLERKQIALNDTDMHAPSSGIILTRVREPGAIVDPSQIVYTLTLDNPVWVRTYVDEPDLGRIHPGLEAEIFTDSAPNKPYHGRIGFISPEAEFTPKNVETTQLRTDLVYRLRVIVANPDKGLRQGMPVTIKIRVDRNNNGQTR